MFCFCAHGNETTYSTKVTNSLGQLNHYQLFKKDPLFHEGKLPHVVPASFVDIFPHFATLLFSLSFCL
jgi:hypothetical protein